MRSVLFVPGPDPDRIEDAAESDADAVVFDLEHSDDTFGRGTDGQRVLDTVERWRELPHQCGVRIHELDTKQSFADVAAICDADAVPDFVVVPEVEYAHELSSIASVLADVGADVYPLIETPRGVFEAASILSVAPTVTATTFGPGDFGSRMGTRELDEVDLSIPRYLVAMAAKSAGITAIDMPSFGGGDDVTRADSIDARAIGYDGKLVISDAGVEIVNEIFDRS